MKKIGPPLTEQEVIQKMEGVFGMTKNFLETSLPQDELWHRIYQALKTTGVQSVTLEISRGGTFFKKFDPQVFAETLANGIKANERDGSQADRG